MKDLWEEFKGLNYIKERNEFRCSLGKKLDPFVVCLLKPEDYLELQGCNVKCKGFWHVGCFLPREIIKEIEE